MLIIVTCGGLSRIENQNPNKNHHNSFQIKENIQIRKQKGTNTELFNSIFKKRNIKKIGNQNEKFMKAKEDSLKKLCGLFIVEE